MLTKETTDTKSSDLKKKKWVKVSKKTKHKHKRSKSKISSALERSFNNEHDEHNTSVTSCSSASSENGLENFAMICITVNLVIISERTSSVSLILNNSSKMSTVIEKAINQFNMKFKEEKMLFKLKTEYETKISKLNVEHVEEISKKDALYNELQNRKASLNIKMIGEELEVWCHNEMQSYITISKTFSL